MLPSFFRLLETVFPAVDQETAERVAADLAEHNYEPRELYDTGPLESVAQGDIVGDFPFDIRTDIDDHLRHDGPAILLSNTCDIEHDPYAVYAVGYPIEVFEGDDDVSEGFIDSIRSNEIHHLFFMPDVPGEGDFVFDLSMCDSLPSRLVFEGGGDTRFDRLVSLSWLGHFLFILKLTVHFLRPESEEVDRRRVLVERGIEP